MAFKNLREDIEAEFAALQATDATDEITRGLSRPGDGGVAANGFHIDPFLLPPAKRQRKVAPSESSRAAKRRYDEKLQIAKIVARIQAGERPKGTRRPPTRWIAVAKTLGIDLGYVAPKAPRKRTKKTAETPPCSA